MELQSSEFPVEKKPLNRERINAMEAGETAEANDFN